MATTYPNFIDGFTQLPLVVDSISPIKATDVNNIRGAAIAIETELGINPSGTFGTVKSRLDSVDLLLGTEDGYFPASRVSIIDADGYYVGGNVELALAELAGGGGGGTITGSGSVDQVTYFSGPLNITSDAGLSYDGTTFGIDRAAVFNESGADVDFRFEGDAEPNLLFIDASTDRVGIGTNTPGWGLDVATAVAGHGGIRSIASHASGVANVFIVADGASGAFRASGTTVATTFLGITDADWLSFVAFSSAAGIKLGTAGSGQRFIIGGYEPGDNNSTSRLEFDDDSMVFNEGGWDFDIRFEGNTEPNLLFIDASTDRIGIGTDTPAVALHVENDQNAPSGVRILNPNTGANANAQLLIGRASTGGAYAIFSHYASRAPSGLLLPNQTVIAGQDVNGFLVLSVNSDLVFGIGNITQSEGIRIRGTGTLGTTDVVINEEGRNIDFRVEGDTEPNLLFIDASTDRVGIGTNTPFASLDVRGSVTFNDAAGNFDFRVEGNTEPNLLFVDASADRIGIGTNTPSATLHVVGSTGSDLVTLTDAANISTNALLGNVFQVTLAGSRTLDNPTNLVAGFTYMWIISQDATGSRTLAYGSLFQFPGGTVPVLSIPANSIDLLSAVYDGTNLYVVEQLNFS